MGNNSTIQKHEHRSSKFNLSKFKTFRKNLRNNLTPAEAEPWNYLKNNQLENSWDLNLPFWDDPKWYFLSIIIIVSVFFIKEALDIVIPFLSLILSKTDFKLDLAVVISKLFS